MPPTTSAPKHLMTSEQWRKEPTTGAALRTARPMVVRAIDIENRTAEFSISTETEDRMRDTISVEGWRLENFMKGGPGPVLWAHQSHELPVGKALRVFTDEADGTKRLKSLAQFPSKEQYPFGNTVFQLLLGSYLKASSVGFAPVLWAFNEERGGFDFLEQELLEWSIVPVPANAEALVDAKSKGIDIAPLREWAIRTLDEIEGGPIQIVKREGVERALKIIEGDPDTFMVPEGFIAVPKNLMITEHEDGGLSTNIPGLTLSVLTTTPAVDGLTSIVAAYELEPSSDDVPADEDTKDEPEGGTEDDAPFLTLSEEPEEETSELTADDVRAALSEVDVAGKVGAAFSEALTGLTGRLD